MNLLKYSKAYVPVVVGLVLYGLSALHVTGSMSVQDAVTAVVTSLIVYLVPNKTA